MRGLILLAGLLGIVLAVFLRFRRGGAAGLIAAIMLAESAYAGQGLPVIELAASTETVAVALPSNPLVPGESITIFVRNMFESEISITSVASDCWCIAAPNLLSPIRPGELGAVRFHASSPDRNAKFWQRNLTLTYTVAGTGETHTSPVRLDFSTVDSPAPKGNVVFTHLASDVQTVAVEFNLHRKHKESDFTLEAVTLDGLPIEVDQANWAPSTSSNNPNTLSVIVMVPMLESPDRYFALDFTFATKKGDRVTRSVLLVQNGHRSYSVTPKSIENLDFTVGEKSDVTFAIRHKEGSPFRVLAQDIPKGVEVVSFDDSTPGTLILNLSVSHTEFETAQSVRRQAGIPALSTIERLISLTVSTGDALDSAFITLHASSIIEQLPPPPGSQ